MLQSYRQILTPQTMLFSATGLVARLPIAMMGLGIVLLAEDASGSYGFAGAVSAVALIANAVFTIPQGRLIDRLGQGRVLSTAVAFWGIGLALAMGSLEWGWPRWTAFVFAALAGAAFPQVGSSVRARWSHRLSEYPDRLHTAFSLEAVVDEMVFIAGPVLVTLLATAVSPVAGLLAALTVGVLGTMAFAAQRDTEPPAHAAVTTSGVRTPMPWITIAPLTIACTALGILFGAAEVVTVAFADEQGHKSWSGVMLALWAFGSLVAGLVSGAINWRQGPLVRLRWGALGMTLAMAPLAFVPSLPVLGVVLLIGGVAISPTVIAAMSLAQQELPAERMTEGMAFIQTGLAAGLAPGAAIAGVVIDAHGASPAYLVCAAGGLLTVLGALLVRQAPRGATVGAHEHITVDDRGALD